MRDNFRLSLSRVLRHEGGFVNNPADPGGMTNLGVTKKAWEEHVGRPVDEATMRGLTPESVETFYRLKYWDRCRGNDLPAGVDYAVFDFAVNSGPFRASRALQKAIGVPDDGIVGDFTISSAANRSAKDLVIKICDTRLAFLRGLPTWQIFGKGWERRVLEVKNEAAGMAE